MTFSNLRRLRQIAEVEFVDIVVDVWVPDVNTMRVMLRDGSYIDVWYSLKLTGRYSYHWERQALDGTIYRHDNAPHRRWQAVATFPKHFHDGSETQVVESAISAVPEHALRTFLAFARQKMEQGSD